MSKYPHTRVLRSDGKYINVILKTGHLFVCCKGCSKKALADPDATLAKVAELKGMSPEDLAAQTTGED